VEDYLDRFKAMVDELRAHPKVHVTHFHVASGIPSWKLERLEERAGFKFSDEIRSFYLKSNGLQLVWIHENAPRFDAETDEVFDSEKIDLDWVRDDDCRATGVVNFLPVEDVLEPSRLWEGQIYFPESNSDKQMIRFHGRELPLLSFLKSIRPFDFFSNIQDAAFLLYDSESNPPVLIGTDSQADYCEYLAGNFSDYLELVLRCKGWIWGRTTKIEGKTVTLDNIIKIAEDEGIL
jgi:hypothetical protein